MRSKKKRIRDQIMMSQVLSWLKIPHKAEGFIECPYHVDNHPSLKLYGGYRGWYCFECNRGGGPTEFLMGHFQITEREANQRLVARFRLDRSSPGVFFERPERSKDELDDILHSWSSNLSRQVRELIYDPSRRVDPRNDWIFDYWVTDLCWIMDVAILRVRETRNLRILDKVAEFILTRITDRVKMESWVLAKGDRLCSKRQRRKRKSSRLRRT